MKRDMNFLIPTTKQIRRSINEIDESYNNDWDPVAELGQNAIDSIRKKSREYKNFKGKIKILIDCKNNKIVFEDNGCGIDRGKLCEVLRPFSSDKFLDSESIGEKGVGLTFVLFACNYFRIKSGNKDGVSEVIVKDAFSWKQSSSNELLQLEYRELEEEYDGTEVEVSNIKESLLLRLNLQQIEFVLRTRTALGNTRKIWGSDIDIDIELIHIDYEGNISSKKIDFKYLSPIEVVQKNAKLDLDEFEKWLSIKDRSDMEKRKELRDKIVFKTGEFIHSDNRKIRFFVCFVPRRKSWKSLSLNTGLYTEQLLNNDIWGSNFHYIGFKDGIFTSLKGMPTGISIETPQSGSAGYWSNMFMLLEDNNLKFDIGRKSIHGSQSRVLRRYAKEIFNMVNKYTKYISGDIPENHDWNKDDIFAKVENLLDLDNSNTKFLKVPTGQEANILAMFFELLGNGVIKGIMPLSLGYKHKYDLYAKWKDRKLVIEFKSSLKDIFEDFVESIKMFDEIDCIVCWNINEKDLLKVKEKSLELEEIDRDKSILGIDNNEKQIPNSTHLLILNSYVNPIYIIDLKKAIENY